MKVIGNAASLMLSNSTEAGTVAVCANTLNKVRPPSTGTEKLHLSAWLDQHSCQDLHGLKFAEQAERVAAEMSVVRVSAGLALVLASLGSPAGRRNAVGCVAVLRYMRGDALSATTPTFDSYESIRRPQVAGNCCIRIEYAPRPGRAQWLSHVP